MTLIAGMPVTLVRHPRARRMKLSLDRRTGALRLSIPPRASAARALAWAEAHAGWAAAQAAKLPEKIALVDGAVFPLLGTPTTLVWCEGRGGRVDPGAAVLAVTCPSERLAAVTLRWLRRHALEVLSADTAEFAVRAGVRVTRVSIGDPRSRWGSCSAAGAIRYSWRLILAPPSVRRATVAHEVAHRLHMDHSPRFHAALATIADEDPRVSRQWLAANGAALHGLGA